MNIFLVYIKSKCHIFCPLMLIFVSASITDNLFAEKNSRSLNDTVPVLVPEPQKIDWLSNHNFKIDPSSIIAISNSADTLAAKMINQEIMNSCGFKIPIKSSVPEKNAIVLRHEGDWNSIPHKYKISSKEQAYSLEVNPDFCVITGHDGAGVFYGAMTLKQLIAQHDGNSIYGIAIEDFPDLPFRGLRTRYSAQVSWQDSMIKRTEYLASLKLNKYILESWDFWKSNINTVKIVQNFFKYCRGSFLEPIPLVQLFGHAESVLKENPYCGEAIHRRCDHFCFLNRKAWNIEDRSIFKVPNVIDEGFENTSNNKLIHWNQDDIGITVFNDTLEKHAGTNSVRLQRDTYGTSRIWQDISCEKNTLYAVWFFAKTQNISCESNTESNGVFIQINGKKGKHDWNLIKKSHVLSGTHQWKKLSVVFNIGDYDTIRIYAGINNAKGSAWIDSERLPIIKNDAFENIHSSKIHWIHNGGGNAISIKGAGINGGIGCKLERIIDGYTRIHQDIEVEPGLDYMLKVWVKTAGVKNGHCYCTAFWISDDGTQYWEDPGGFAEFKGFLMSDRIDGTHGWTQLSTNFYNSGPCNTLRIKLVLDGIGTAFFDDVVLYKTNKSLVNIDTTAPLTITDEQGYKYKLNKDYDLISGEELSFPFNLDAEPTSIVLTNNSRIRDSQIVYVSYDKFPVFQLKNDPGFYPYCPTKSATWQIVDSRIANVIENLDPRTLHFGHDEIAFMKTDYPCLHSNKTCSELLSDEINKLYNRVKPRQMMVWADMLNPHHLGRFYPNDPTYPATNHIDKKIIPIVWFYKNIEPFTRGDSSLVFFEKQGFRTIAACAGYDEFNAYNWAYEIKHRWLDCGDSSCFGLLNTKWGSEKDFTTGDWYSLPIVAEFAWHWPDSINQRSLEALRYDALTLHRNYGDIFVPRPVGLKTKMLRNNKIMLTWYPNPNMDHKHYVIYRDNVAIATTADTYYTEKVLPGMYVYTITAVDFLDNESPYSKKCLLTP